MGHYTAGMVALMHLVEFFLGAGSIKASTQPFRIVGPQRLGATLQSLRDRREIRKSIYGHVHNRFGVAPFGAEPHRQQYGVVPLDQNGVISHVRSYLVAGQAGRIVPSAHRAAE